MIIKLKTLLCFSIQEPEISHLYHTGRLFFDSVIDDVNSSGVIDVDGCWRLWMPKFVESKAEDFGCLGIEEEGT